MFDWLFIENKSGLNISVETAMRGVLAGWMPCGKSFTATISKTRFHRVKYELSETASYSHRK
ncbi:MAG TPA: hypothetical protein VHG71_03135 [Verrucomicrobiae bacterium]|nr:hypothetical protein [Verrucomicrobiae bacterium]